MPHHPSNKYERRLIDQKKRKRVVKTFKEKEDAAFPLDFDQADTVLEDTPQGFN